MTGLTFINTQISADVDPQDIGSENIKAPEEEAGAGPFKLRALVDVVGKAKVKNSFANNHLYFSTGQGEAGLVYYYDACIEEGANVVLLYQNTYLDWEANPYFTQKDISTLGLELGGFTKRLPDWTWSGQLTINFDNVGYWNFQDYMYYDMLLWGRYAYCKNIGLHIGFLAETGMKMDRVYPIIGVDWEYDCNWKVNLIFPLNISVVYTINTAWSVAFASRFFDERHRVKKKEWLSEGLWHYQSTGAEFGINYTPTKWISANLHAGSTLGGHLKIADRHYKHRHRVRLDPAPYVGGEVTVNF